MQLHHLYCESSLKIVVYSISIKWLRHGGNLAGSSQQHTKKWVLLPYQTYQPFPVEENRSTTEKTSFWQGVLYSFQMRTGFESRSESCLICDLAAWRPKTEQHVGGERYVTKDEKSEWGTTSLEVVWRIRFHRKEKDGIICVALSYQLTHPVAVPSTPIPA